MTNNSPKYDYTMSITFGDVAENHAGMQRLGTLAQEGLSLKTLQSLRYDGNVYDLRGLLCKEKKEEAEEAYIAVLPGGVDAMLGKGTADALLTEMCKLPFDSKAYMRRQGVVNKHARWNNCFADFSQSPDFEEGKGTVINFKDTTHVKALREKLQPLINTKELVAETNLYYDLKKCYIGYHGDSERKIVVCARLGADFPLHYQWYQNSTKVGERCTFDLKHGDVYFMSAKAVGHDWKKKKILTLRHAAGYSKMIKL